LLALHDPLRAAWRAARVEPFVVRASEVARLADAFPIKILDIHRHHVVLAGEDPFAAVKVEPGEVRLRAEQELRNHLLRLRRHYVFTGDNPMGLAKAIYRSASALRYELGALLYLRGEAVGWRISEVLPAAAKSLGLDADTLARVEQFHRGQGEPQIVNLFHELIQVVEAAVFAVDALGCPR
jgi:hypothetical protein